MSKASKKSCRLTLMLGVVMASSAAAVAAVPLVEKAAHAKSEKVANTKPVHFIESRSEADPKVHEAPKAVELPLLGTEKPPVSEPLPLELKGVRG